MGREKQMRKNEWGTGKWVRWHPYEWAYTKNMMPYKNKSAASMTKMSIDDNNEWEYTHNNQPPRASVLWQKINKGKQLFWMADGSAKQNRLTFSPCSESNLFRLARKLLPDYHDGAPQYC